MPKKKFVYEVVEENEDPMQTKFVKKDVEVEFTMGELKDHEERVDGMIKEIASKIEMENAAMENVNHFHEKSVALVSQLDPEEQHALFVWLRAKATVLEMEPKLTSLKAIFKEHNDEMKDIIKQTGWKAPDIHLTLGKDAKENKKQESVESTEGES